MVVAATEQLIDAECSESNELRSRLVTRLRDMEKSFTAEVASGLGLLTDPPNQ